MCVGGGGLQRAQQMVHKSCRHTQQSVSLATVPRRKHGQPSHTGWGMPRVCVCGARFPVINNVCNLGWQHIYAHFS